MKNTFNLSFSLIMLFLLSSCAKKPSQGVYFSQGNPADYIELKGDGIFLRKTDNMTFSGKYRAEKDEISFFYDAALGKVDRANFSDTLLSDSRGSIWILWSAGKSGLQYEKQYKEMNPWSDLQRCKDAMINDFLNIAYHAHQHRLKTPTHTFQGFIIPPRTPELQRDGVATYTSEANKDFVIITATLIKLNAGISAKVDADGKVQDWTYFGLFE